MGPIEWIRNRLKLNKKTTPTGTIEKEFGVHPAASRLMEDNINLWWSLYVNHPPWETCDVRPLGLPGAIGRELASHAFTEFDMEVSGSARASYLNKQIEKAAEGFSKDLELGLCLGGIALKPYPDGDRILVDASTTNFTPTRFDGTGKAIGGVFRTMPARQGDKYFVRMEYHDFQQTEDAGTLYIIRNKAFYSDQTGSIGTEVPLDSVPDWASLEPEVRIEGLTGPLFAYFKPPAANRVEPESKLGVSVYSGEVVDLIRQADEQWEQIRWEYKSGERKIIVDNATVSVDPEQLDERLFMKGTFTGTGELFNVFTPEFRNEQLYQGFQYTLKIIEYCVGLSFGTISDPQSVNKTATEEIMTKHRQYVTESSIQKAFQATLEDLLYAMNALCDLANLAPSGDYQAKYSWGDGVLDDPETKRQDKAMDVTLVDRNLMSRVSFVMKWNRVDEKTARKMIAEIDADAAEDISPLPEEFE